VQLADAALQFVLNLFFVPGSIERHDAGTYDKNITVAKVCWSNGVVLMTRNRVEAWC
jgi:hypothetical protein